MQLKKCQLTFFASKRRTIHSLAHRLQDEPDCFFDCDLIFVILLQQTLCCTVVRADARRFPTGIVAGRIRVVELELVVRVPAGVEEGDAEWTKT